MLETLSTIGILLIAILHIWFCILEMFLWQKPLGMKTFKTDPAFAQRSAPLAANQGLYNLFLSAGLFWSVYPNHDSLQIKCFFLSCVILAGIYGGITVSRKIFFIQALPAIITLALLLPNLAS